MFFVGKGLPLEPYSAILETITVSLTKLNSTICQRALTVSRSVVTSMTQSMDDNGVARPPEDVDSFHW